MSFIILGHKYFQPPKCWKRWQSLSRVPISGINLSFLKYLSSRYYSHSLLFFLLFLILCHIMEINMIAICNGQMHRTFDVWILLSIGFLPLYTPRFYFIVLIFVTSNLYQFLSICYYLFFIYLLIRIWAFRKINYFKSILADARKQGVDCQDVCLDK